MYPLIHMAVLAVTILVLARLLPSVRIRSAGTAVLVAVVFSVLNFFLGWLIRAMLFVPALLTLGLLFFFVPFIVNTVLLWLTDKAIGSFEIRSLRGLLDLGGGDHRRQRRLLRAAAERGLARLRVPDALDLSRRLAVARVCTRVSGRPHRD